MATLLNDPLLNSDQLIKSNIWLTIKPFNSAIDL